MRLILMKEERGFLEPLSGHADHSIQFVRWVMEDWVEDRHLEKFGYNKKDHITIMPMARFLEFISSPVMEVIPLTNTPLDRRPQVTLEMQKLYTVGAAHAKCTHVVLKT